MKVAGIYKITSPSGKVYIGQSWDMDARWNEYKSKKGAPNQPALKHSLLKYGAKNHHFALVWGFQYPIQDLLDGAETMYIRLNKQAGKEMLNIKEGGRGGLHSPETKKKMSLKRKGVSKSKSFCEAITKRQLGIPRGEGEKNNKAKLTLDQVLEIRKNFNGLFSYYSKMASLYGVDKASIGNIIRRKNLETYMSIRLITFATEDYDISAQRLKATALRYGADGVQIYDKVFFGESFQHIINPLIPNSRGYGWWVWKPFICWKTINQLQDGDILIYCDAGNDIVDDLNNIISKMDEDIFLFSNGWQHSHWCKAETAIAINGGGYIEDGKVSALPPNYLTHKQVQASSLFFRVSRKTRNFIQEWYAWSIMPGMIDNTPRGPQFPEFQEHRHDQAILTCLQIKYDIKLHWFPSTTNHHQHIQGDNYPQIFAHHRKKNHEW